LQTEFENTENKQIMYAIVDIAGQQFKVEKDQKLFVHRLEGDAGSEVSFDKVLLIENDGKITFGNPVIKDAAVSAKVVEHLKGDKVLIFKKKRRKGYQKLNGHRQYLTRIEITGIAEKVEKKAAAKAEEKKAAPKAAETKATAEKAVTDKKEAATTKSTAAKKPAAEKKATAAKAPAAEKKNAPAKAPATKKPAAAKKAAPAKAPSAKKPAAAKKDNSEGKAADKE
jgi:large subunit ribosomal protein L21